MWSGRLGAGTARRVEEYTTSIDVDRRLYADDIDGSLAHLHMLRAVGLISADEGRAVEAALRDIRREFERNTFVVDDGDEDIHSAIERRLFEIAGEAAGRLHTGRSRNDQVATDLRLYSKRIIRELMLAIALLQEALARRAEQHRSTPMPGYTHGQRAQVVSLAHHLLAYVEMLQRDIGRLEDAHDRCDVLPLGSGALAGSTLPLDRRAVARELNFSSISANSLDAVADRDFVVELTAACSLTMVHLSRMAEELVLWTSAEYGFAELPDTHATGSSLMPQKKNPDVLELVRGRAARTIGDLTGLLALLKGLPLAYNRDLQEDKVLLFDAVDTSLAALAMVTDVVRVLRFNRRVLLEAASDPALLATDVAEYLVTRGMPFRAAHHLVGNAVRRSLDEGRTLRDLTAAEWRQMTDLAGDDIGDLFDVDGALRRREIPGGPGPRTVSRQLVRAATLVAKTRRIATVLARQPGAAKEVGAAVRASRPVAGDVAEPRRRSGKSKG
ncbi:MAG: argininosuccinate lyase [Candidatus Dormibacteraeota bacterium]|uniref:Argininosuccinate lyase n=1 Tax=Candidatus Amunia macphersoniae TaxID=3127014 RepID=A0A934NEL7_9BACT|nr:argininosuccinate lyase [Candidatus Dormibacteraeota bacterium]